MRGVVSVDKRLNVVRHAGNGSPRLQAHGYCGVSSAVLAVDGYHAFFRLQAAVFVERIGSEQFGEFNAAALRAADMAVQRVIDVHIQNVRARGIVGKILLARVRLVSSAVQGEQAVLVRDERAAAVLVRSERGYLAASAYEVVFAVHRVGCALLHIAVLVVDIGGHIARKALVPGEQGVIIVVNYHVVSALASAVRNGQ